MKSKYLPFLVTICFAFASTFIFAQSPPPAPPAPAPVPIDGGILLLLVSGVSYGIKRLYNKEF